MMKNVLCSLLLFLWAVPVPCLAAEAAGAPRVVASIAPVHSLVAGVMAGVGTPELIVKRGGSPHSYALRPSEARALAAAQVIVWVGPSLESFLAKPLATLGGKARVLTLAEAPGVRLLPAREGGVWESEEGEPEEEAEHDHAHAHDHGTYDPHLWLDPQNAKAIVRTVVDALGKADPSHLAAYRSNGRQLEARLDALQADLDKQLAPVRKIPFVVFHDAYQYFDRRFGLNAVGSITVSPEQAPGVRRLEETRAKIVARHARCVFSEPQFRPQLVATLIEGTTARSGVLDPEGVDLPPGPEAYFTLMRRMGDQLRDCLGEKKGGSR